jgi:hypothetical protein
MNQEIVVIITTISYGIAVLYAMILSKKKLVERKKKRLEAKKKFFETIINGLNLGTIQKLDDVINVYIPIVNIKQENIEFSISLSDYLREFLLELNTNKGFFKGINAEKIIEWKVKITQFIDDNEKILPSDFLPNVERNLINDLSYSMEIEDKNFAKRKIQEITDFLLYRNEEIYRLKRNGRYTMILSIAGVVLTIVFGYLSIK